MTDRLLPYYNQELQYLRRFGAEFAQEHPKIAGRLRLGDDLSEDPHVSRIIESFALLAARTRLKLDDDFPDMATIMRQRNAISFRKRQHWETAMRVKFSQTIRPFVQPVR